MTRQKKEVRILYENKIQNPVSRIQNKNLENLLTSGIEIPVTK